MTRFPGDGVLALLIYPCACTAQVCRSLIELRELHDYLMQCMESGVNDRLVQETIAQATAQAHAALEACLERILEIEGWDRERLVMSDNLKKRPAKPL